MHTIVVKDCVRILVKRSADFGFRRYGECLIFDEILPGFGSRMNGFCTA